MECVEVTGSLRDAGGSAGGNVRHAGVEGDQVVFDETLNVAYAEIRLHDTGAGHI